MLYIGFILLVANNWIWISWSSSMVIPSILQNFTNISCGIDNMTLLSPSFIKVASTRNLLSEFFRSGFEDQFVQVANTPIAWALLLHFLQNWGCSNKFKVSGGNITFSEVLVAWTSLTWTSVFDCLITVPVVVVRYFPLKLFTLRHWSL